MRSIRKRGVHRAIKRGEPWAKQAAIFKALVSKLTQDMYADDLIGTPYELFGLSEWIPSKPQSEPFFGLDRTTPPILRPNMKLTLWEKIRRIWNR